MNSSVIRNRAEIMLYSSLISVMSGLNSLKSHILDQQTISEQAIVDDQAEAILRNEYIKENRFSLNWVAIQEAMPPLLLWLILGFAAGFLLGMIGPG